MAKETMAGGDAREAYKRRMDLFLKRRFWPSRDLAGTMDLEELCVITMTSKAILVFGSDRCHF